MSHMDEVNADIAGANICPCKLFCNILFQKPDKSITYALIK
jgi:hypothetical protein